ncbi:uncharacterized protein LOC129795610 [Lutzomyia longipalpis]|uniref:uncharacterized protein LOC129795610 n=1 Tax=Lutzomyia longipalpis TaxID=7200 RepID=UPI00248397A3|nr:uncharacterized protein LOC129795610 [Lutzomyia longipalpis]
MFDIKITQFVNPHLFYYQLEEDELGKKPFEEDLERILPARDYFVGCNQCYSPAIGEIVGHYNMIENKWLRAQVDYVTYSLTNEKVYFLFALDYGYSLESIGKWLRPLPEIYKVKSQKIFMGGIKDIIPCDLWVNPVSGKQEYGPSKHWNRGAVMQMIRMIDSSHSMTFTPEFRLTNGQHFGRLHIKTLTLDVEDVATVLAGMNFALKSEDFLADLPKLFTRHFPRWQGNDRNAVSFGLSTVTPQLYPLATEKARGDDGEDIESNFVHLQDSTVGKVVWKLTRNELDYFRNAANVKVRSWQEQNAKYFQENPIDGNPYGQEKVNEMLKMLEMCTVEERSEASRNVPKKLPVVPEIMEKKEQCEEIAQPRKINIKALLQEAMDTPETPAVSVRAIAKPKPAGYIHNTNE